MDGQELVRADDPDPHNDVQGDSLHHVPDRHRNLLASLWRPQLLRCIFRTCNHTTSHGPHRRLDHRPRGSAPAVVLRRARPPLRLPIQHEDLDSNRTSLSALNDNVSASRSPLDRY
ncbi:hypothetical protein AB1N83_012063 [Pleurotus pulmonarius]